MFSCCAVTSIALTSLLAGNGKSYATIIESGDVSQQIYQHKLTVGEPRLGIRPASIARDKTGNIYVAEADNSRILVLDAAGKYLREFGERDNENGHFFKPDSVSVDSKGQIYVSDFSNFSIQVFDANGNFQFKLDGRDNETPFGQPKDVAVSDNGAIYVAAGNSIYLFDNSGNFQSKFGHGGNSIGHFATQAAVALDNADNIYVLDWSTHQVQKFDANGKLLLKFGGEGSSDGEFNHPMDIAVDSSGKVYVADTYNNRIQIFNALGKFEQQVGSYGSANSQFVSPGGVAVDMSGNIYVADSGNHRIQMLAPKQSSASIAGAASPYSANIDESFTLDGTDFFLDNDGSFVSYAWDLDSDDGVNFDNPDFTGMSPEVSYASKGRYTVTLQVTNDEGETLTETTTAYIEEAPRAMWSETTLSASQSITFSASSSFHEDPLRTIVSYEWDFDYDGSNFSVTEEGETVTIRLSGEELNVALRVTDDHTNPISDLDIGTYTPYSECQVGLDHSHGDCSDLESGGGAFGWLMLLLLLGSRSFRVTQK